MSSEATKLFHVILKHSEPRHQQRHGVVYAVSEADAKRLAQDEVDKVWSYLGWALADVYPKYDAKLKNGDYILWL